MASYSYEEISKTRHIWSVPVDVPFGACWTEVSLAIRAAHAKLWQLKLVTQDQDAPADAIRVGVSDDEVLVWFDVSVDKSGDTFLS